MCGGCAGGAVRACRTVLLHRFRTIARRTRADLRHDGAHSDGVTFRYDDLLDRSGNGGCQLEDALGRLQGGNNRAALDLLPGFDEQFGDNDCLVRRTGADRFDRREPFLFCCFLDPGQLEVKQFGRRGHDSLERGQDIDLVCEIAWHVRVGACHATHRNRNARLFGHCCDHLRAHSTRVIVLMHDNQMRRVFGRCQHRAFIPR